MLYIYIALSSYRTRAFKRYIALYPTDCYSQGGLHGKALEQDLPVLCRTEQAGPEPGSSCYFADQERKSRQISLLKGEKSET